MKKLLLTLALSSVLLTSSIFAISIDTYNADIRIKKSAVSYAYLYIKGISPFPKDYDKAIEVLNQFKDIDEAKMLLAYCYYKGYGTAVDIEKTDELLSKIDTRLSSYSMIYNDIKNNDFEFVIKIADTMYAQTNDFQNSYQYIFNNLKLIKEKHKDHYDRIINNAKADIEKNAGFLLQYNAKNTEEIMSLLKYFRNSNDANRFYKLKQLFNNLIRENKPEYVKDVIAFYERISYPIDNYMAELAYFYSVGFGVEQNDKLADQYFNKSLESKENSFDNIFYFIVYNNQNPSTQAKDFIERYAKALYDIGKPEKYLIYLASRINSKKDPAYLIDCIFDILNKYPNKYEPCLRNNITYWLLYNKEYQSLDDQHKTKLFKILESINSKTDSNFDQNNIFYYDFLINGVGVAADGKKAFDALVKLNKSNVYDNFPRAKCMLLEYIAHCYQNGFGVEKDIKKAYQIRDEILAIADKNLSESGSIISVLSNFYNSHYYPYRKNRKSLSKYYGEKLYEYRLLVYKDKLDHTDKKIFNDFISIANDFKEDKNLENIDERVAQLFNKLIDTKSNLIDEIVELILNTDRNNISSLKLRKAVIPYMKKIADSYKPELYGKLANSYKYNTDLSGRELSLYCYLKSADYITDNDKKIAALYSAIDVSQYLNKEKVNIEIMSKIEALNPEHNTKYTVEKAITYLVKDKQYRNEAEAKKLLDNALNTTESPKDLYSYLSYLSSNFYNDIIFRYYAFKFALKLEKTGDKSNETKVNETLMNAYRYGIVTSKDIEKAVDYFIKYAYENKSSVTSYYELDFLLWLFKDVEDANPQLLHKVLEKGVQNNSKIAKFIKGVAVLEGFGYEKDESANQEFYKFISNNLQISYDYYSYYSNVLNISKDTYQNFLNNMQFNGKHSYEFSHFNHKAGNIEEAIKYGYIQGKNATDTNMGISLDLFYKTRPTEEIAEFVSTSDKAFMKLIYADLLYKGDCVKQDKQKAFEIVEDLFEKYVYNSYRAATFVWLHNHYKLENRQDKIEKLLAYCYIYSYYYTSSFATLYADNQKLSIMYSPLVGNDIKSAKELLELSETQYYNKELLVLAQLYGYNVNFKNIDKKREIVNRAKKYVDNFLKKQ